MGGRSRYQLAKRRNETKRNDNQIRTSHPVTRYFLLTIIIKMYMTRSVLGPRGQKRCVFDAPDRSAGSLSSQSSGGELRREKRRKKMRFRETRNNSLCVSCSSVLLVVVVIVYEKTSQPLPSGIEQTRMINYGTTTAIPRNQSHTIDCSFLPKIRQ